ncbi:trihelix transcription factor ASR3-like isoform X1 [Hibiscus syriacus]|uniref:trihelix transcription factor ASR3-like isoform X1 n=1 Tax=Hibiscus syriacus TaxID=106335 RepID=UPI00192255C0|nr:trihelix transcription factor ASR3-like isoform X1 [Hibiscus syriacus]
MTSGQLSLVATTDPVDGQRDYVNADSNDVESRPMSADCGDDVSKAPRLPRWTRQEILVLIQGKRVAENRVRRGRAAGLAFGSGQVEPKWASVSSYCKRHGVNRGPVQCRKRWSNLAGDFKKIKEWDNNTGEESESFWAMRNDLRRERKLPGFFDKEVYDILDGAATAAEIPSSVMAPDLALALTPTPAAQDVAEDAETVFDSGRSAAAEDGQFSDFEQDDGCGSPEKVEPALDVDTGKAVPAPIPISEQQYRLPQQPSIPGIKSQGTTKEKHPTSNPEFGSSSQEARKRKRMATDGDEEMSSSPQYHLIDVLEKNGKILVAQLEAQNINFQQDREQRKDHGHNLVAVLNKLADALGRIADKL